MAEGDSLQELQKKYRSVRWKLIRLPLLYVGLFLVATLAVIVTRTEIGYLPVVLVVLLVLAYLPFAHGMRTRDRVDRYWRYRREIKNLKLKTRPL